MCGIVGAIGTADENNLENIVDEMSSAIRHRGPDGEGYYKEQGVTMGMRRLSIIDIAHGNQPFKSKNEDIIVFYNGEIYNYIEIKAQLVKRNHHFKTQGDGEVILHLYEEYGIDFIRHLRGMFAIAIYDRRKNRFFLIRDRMGEKPVYYHKTSGGSTFYYASEMKALITAISADELTLSARAVDLFLKYQFIPEPFTMFSEVLKLCPGHYLELDTLTLDFETKTYWKLTESEFTAADTISQSIKKELESVSNIIGRSDVGIGIALSGGIDSSAIAAIFTSQPHMKEISHAFTVGYEGRPRTDERQHAVELARKLNIPVHDIEITTQELVKDFSDLVYHMDDPIGDIAAYSIYRIMKAASERNIKVMLNGIGADELFWGYQWIVDVTCKTVEKVAGGDDQYLCFYDYNPVFIYAKKMEKKLYHRDFVAKLTVEHEKEFYPLNGTKNIPIQMINTLCRTWLTAGPVALNDRLSMANSVELRSPFLDHHIVELAVFANKQDTETYLNPLKSNLKDALKSYLPESILNRPKQGFTPPMRKWLVTVYKEYGHLLWNGMLMNSGLFSKVQFLKLLVMLKIWGAVTNRKLMYVYKLIVLEIWLRRFTVIEQRQT